MVSISPDCYEQSAAPVKLVQKLEVIAGGKQTEQKPALAQWVIRKGKLVCCWNVQ